MLRLAALALALVTAAEPRPTYNRRTGLYEPPFAELVRAVDRGDRAEIGRWAARIGPARLAEALRGPDGARARAALTAATLLPGRGRLLEVIAPLCASDDAELAERAARALGRVLDAGEPRDLADWDVPADAVAAACRSLAQAAARATRLLPVRLAAIESLAEAGPLCPAAPVAALTADQLPEIRRAALLALRPSADTPLAAALGDAEPPVAVAAAVALCRRAYAGRPAAPPRPWRELVRADGAPIEDQVEILPCLAASGDPADRAALEELRHGNPGPLRDRAAELLAGERPSHGR